ncbi:hypothetical protein BpHYR1_038586 [Brachionus plicatilis]|uniref:Uncharacterized protein n=1 Tax=Brachionus plicatilis TaxID=10195 RepID=A0A3M7RSK2_BRAPC|nr:hypothetical protein BpHYR1_038586 [Brachionus plicatilis]
MIKPFKILQCDKNVVKNSKIGSFRVSQELIQCGIFKFNDEYYTQKQGLPIRFIDDILIADLIEIDLDELLSQFLCLKLSIRLGEYAHVI